MQKRHMSNILQKSLYYMIELNIDKYMVLYRQGTRPIK